MLSTPTSAMQKIGTVPAARRTSDGRVQPLPVHLSGVSRFANRFAGPIGLPLAGRLIGLLHDLGKSTEEFQTYLFGSDRVSDVEPQDELKGKIDHSTAGGVVIRDELAAQASLPMAAELAAFLALPIFSHHSGLIDCVTPGGEDRLTLRFGKDPRKTRKEEAWSTLDPAIRYEALAILRDPQLAREVGSKIGRILRRGTTDSTSLEVGLLVRFLFSCLIDADRTDSADFDNLRAATLRQHAQYPPWDVLLERLHAKLEGLDKTSEINRIRWSISDECFAAASRPRGIYTLTVPTGGGKTLGSLRFALEHARQRNLDRLIFVSPYISIVEQNAAVARAFLEPSSDSAGVVLEHHSNLPFEPAAGHTQREHWRRKVLAENWDAPVVFTTMVQVLEALFGGGTRSVRRLHAMANAVIVFDEVQTLPVKMVHLFNNAINLIARECESTVLLCTATQPALHKVDAVKGAVQLAPEAELIAKVDDLFRSLQRYVVHDESSKPGGWTTDEIAALARTQAEASGSCLVIVNQKRDARAIFERCKEEMPEARVVHLSTNMCPAHRLESLSDLKSWLQNATVASPVVCVSTQLIEAGVDIDFATVVRDLAGLDSIAQAAGRCNRNGRREQGHVFIVKVPEISKQLDDIRQGRDAAQRILDDWRQAHPGEPFPLDSPDQMARFFQQAFYNRSGDMVYKVSGERNDTLLSMLGKNAVAVADAQKPLTREILRQSFATAAEHFELIGHTQGIVVPFREEGTKIINDLCAAHDLTIEWQLLRRAQPYTVSVYDHAFRTLCDKGAIYEIEDKGVFCLRPEFYDDEFGLRDEAGWMEGLYA